MSHPGDDMVLSIFGGKPSMWDERRRRQLAIIAYRAGERELMRKWPADDEDGLAVALGKLRYALGY